MDVVDESNLQRQILHNIDRIGDRKVDSAKKTLTALNPDVNVVDLRRAPRRRQRARHHRRLRRHRRRRRQLPVALPPERRVAAEAASRSCTARSSGSRARRRCSTRTSGPCYRCMIPEPPPAELAPSCAEAGVLGVLPGIIGSHPGDGGDQAASSVSATRLRAACSPTTRSSSRSAPSRCNRDPECPACGTRRRRDRHRRVRRVLHAAPGSLELREASGQTRSAHVELAIDAREVRLDRAQAEME